MAYSTSIVSNKHHGVYFIPLFQVQVFIFFIEKILEILLTDLIRTIGIAFVQILRLQSPTWWHNWKISTLLF